MTTPVITRFAPSPTGFLHIGGARTALFNWLFARHYGGKMLLRIEDTDRARSTDEAITAILEGLDWLELDADEDPIYQFARADKHRAAVERLLKEGKAYKCYSSPEELAEMREKARAEGRPPGYDGRWRDRDPSEAPEGVAPAIRLKAPREGETVVNDLVQGTVTWSNDQLDDLILLRSDGTPTYMLSVVVDDHDMGVSHVIRGDDHLTNAARQTQIFNALGWDTPEFAHIPLIHGPDGAKLSKRHGALGVDAYRDMGYLPEAMRNYLARLGWSHGDDEIFSTEQMIEWFGLDAVGKAPARFDFDKLESVNYTHLRNKDDEALVEDMVTLMPHIEGGPALLAKVDEDKREQLITAMPGLKERAKTLLDLINGARFLFIERPLPIDEKSAKLLSDEARDVLADIVPALETISQQWSIENIERVVRDFTESKELKLGKVAQPLRAALTGTTTSPGIFDVLEVLGPEEAIARISDQASSR
ncbi:MAG: glutamate--tRNA ligase [Hyphomicrobiales bacterium]